MSDYIKEIPQDPEREKALKAVREKHNNFKNLSKEERRVAVDEWYEVNAKYPKKLATVSDFVDHIDHIVKLIGIDYVGIGTDFDGGGELEDCYDVSQLSAITLELYKRGYSAEDIKKIWSGNFLRVFREVENNKI